MLGKKWRIATLSDVVWIVPRTGGGSVPEGASPVAKSLATWLVDGWLPDETRSRAVVAEMVDLLAGPLPERRDMSFAAQRALVRQALAAGELKAFRVEMQFVLAPTKRKEEKGERAPLREEKTWFGIELVDDDDPPKPVAFKRYRVELADGSSREGMLDQNGQARIVGIDPGACKVSFPDLHGEDWRRL
jgi:hypothetical protein